MKNQAEASKWRAQSSQIGLFLISLFIFNGRFRTSSTWIAGLYRNYTQLKSINTSLLFAKTREKLVTSKCACALVENVQFQIVWRSEQGLRIVNNPCAVLFHHNRCLWVPRPVLAFVLLKRFSSLTMAQYHKCTEITAAPYHSARRDCGELSTFCCCTAAQRKAYARSQPFACVRCGESEEKRFYSSHSAQNLRDNRAATATPPIRSFCADDREVSKEHFYTNDPSANDEWAQWWEKAEKRLSHTMLPSLLLRSPAQDRVAACTQTQPRQW